jgi:hypothetical protein
MWIKQDRHRSIAITCASIARGDRSCRRGSIGNIGSGRLPLRFCGVQSPEEAKGRLRNQLRQAEEQLQALSALSDRIREVVGDVDLQIGGTMTEKDKEARRQLEANLTGLRQLVTSIRAAVEAGRNAANDIR